MLYLVSKTDIPLSPGKRRKAISWKVRSCFPHALLSITLRLWAGMAGKTAVCLQGQMGQDFLSACPSVGNYFNVDKTLLAEHSAIPEFGKAY